MGRGFGGCKRGVNRARDKSMRDLIKNGQVGITRLSMLKRL